MAQETTTDSRVADRSLELYGLLSEVKNKAQMAKFTRSKINPDDLLKMITPTMEKDW